jgi:hypothetical protein
MIFRAVRVFRVIRVSVSAVLSAGNAVSINLQSRLFCLYKALEL